MYLRTAWEDQYKEEERSNIVVLLPSCYLIRFCTIPKEDKCDVDTPSHSSSRGRPDGLECSLFATDGAGKAVDQRVREGH